MDSKKINKTKYLAVFAITTLIFLIGLVIGSKISDTKLGKIDNLEHDIRTDTMAIELQYLLLAEDPCSSVNSTTLTEELYEIGSKLDFMEQRLGKKNKDVIRLKNYYSLLELRHWLFMKTQQKECNTDNTLVLYFYSNLEDCDKCEEQGFVLNYLRKKYPSVNVYSFDININNMALDTVKNMFNVKKAPTVIINENVLDSFSSLDYLERFIY